MIRCKHCGNLVQAELASCQICGMPLSGTEQDWTGSGNGLQEQPELPAWLQSLRAHERPGSTPGEQPYFSPGDLIDEGALPSWMRPENAEMLEKSNSAKYPAWRPASMPAPHTEEGALPPPKGFSASSLVDEQSLPSWVHGKQGYPPAGAGAPFAANQPGKQPDWMQAFPSTPPPTARGSSAHELIDPQATPGWMDGQSNPPGYPPQDAQTRLAASSLLDPDSLPTWLRENEHAQGHPRQAPGEKGGLSGASLIDANVLPEWLRNADQQQAGMPPAGNARSAGYGVAPRAESVRVPSRPRAEMSPHEQSEAAANVFSSLLGVASTAPNIPFTGVPSPAPSGNAAPSQQAFQGGQYQGPQWNASYQQAGPGGVPAAQGYNPYVGSQPGMPPQPPPAYGPPRAGQRSNSPGAKPARRGIIETIRSWFS